MNVPSSLPIIDVERRFDEAVRAGRPEWLWFEVAELGWVKAVATIETVLRGAFSLGRSDGLANGRFFRYGPVFVQNYPINRDEVIWILG